MALAATLRGELEERLTIADRLHGLRDAIAADATAIFLQRHPNWVTRYDDRARERGEEDARLHIDLLASSAEHPGGGRPGPRPPRLGGRRGRRSLLGGRAIAAAALVCELGAAEPALMCGAQFVSRVALPAGLRTREELRDHAPPAGATRRFSR